MSVPTLDNTGVMKLSAEYYRIMWCGYVIRQYNIRNIPLIAIGPINFESILTVFKNHFHPIILWLLSQFSYNLQIILYIDNFLQ